MNNRQDHPVIVIRPEPAEEEAAAIIAAVLHHLSRRQVSANSQPPTKPATSKWLAAARREALRGLDNDF